MNPDHETVAAGGAQLSPARRRQRAGALGLALAASLGTVLSLPQASLAKSPTVPVVETAGGACGTGVDATQFATAKEFEQLTSRIAGFGLRLPGSTEHDKMLHWLENRLKTTEGLQITEQPYTLTRWQPTIKAQGAPGRDMSRSGSLALVGPDGSTPIDNAGAIAFTIPTAPQGATGPVVYLPPNVPITAANSAGKIVLRDVPSAPIPNAALSSLAYHQTPDVIKTGVYDRPFTVTGSTVDLMAADRAGAKGVVQAFNVPTEQVRGYFDPHDGTLQHVPGVWVGVDEREQLKQIAATGGQVRLDVHAEIDQNVPTRNVIATLPGMSAEKITLVTNTDGNTWVQENGSAALLNLAEYLAKLPISCRPKTIEFAFTSSHLAYAYDGASVYSDSVVADPSKTPSVVFVAEHLGTREIAPVPRTDGPGQVLKFTGQAETYAWFAPVESPALSTALVNAVKAREQVQTSVLRGLDAPNPNRAPVFCNFGGLANFFHGRFIPSVGGISGPWSLWAPSFGKAALDFDRMRSQTLVIGDTILALDDLSKAQLAGIYPQQKARAAAGAPGCDTSLPLPVAPR